MKILDLRKEFISVILLLIIFSMYGCAKYKFEQYSANESMMTCYRERLLEEKAQVGIAINGQESHFHIPFIWRKMVVKSPYKIEIAITTQLLNYDYVLIHSVKLLKETGEMININRIDDPIRLNFVAKNYSVFALEKAYEAYYEFPNKLEIDYIQNENLSVILEISLVSENIKLKKAIKAHFYAFLEEGSMPVNSTYKGN